MTTDLGLKYPMNLNTTFVRSWCTWCASCVVAKHEKNKNKFQTGLRTTPSHWQVHTGFYLTWQFNISFDTGIQWNVVIICNFVNETPMEGMVVDQLCRIVFGISFQIGRDGHRDTGDVSTYGKIIRNLLCSMKPPGSNLCTNTRR